MSQMPNLSAFLSAASCLVDSSHSKASPNLKYVLLSRLSQYHSLLGSARTVSESNTLEEVEVTTAKEALYILRGVQQILGVKEQPQDGGMANGAAKTVGSSTEVPLIGTRDLAELRTLLSIIFKWGVDPLLTKVILSWPSKPASGSKIIDLTSTPADYKLLSSFVSRLMALVFPDGLIEPSPQTHITTIMLNRHMADLLRPCIALGWLPKSLASYSTPPLDAIRPLTMRLLAIVPPSQAITALGIILSSSPSPPLHVQKSCASLLSRQLLRPEGVRGLCAAIFGEEESSDDNAPLEKIQHVAWLLTAVPAGVKPEEYYHAIIPRTIMLLSNTVPPAHRRAAAFTVSRMLGTGSTFPYHTMTSTIVLAMLHLPFLRGTSQRGTEQVVPDNPAPPPSALHHMTTTVALSTLVTLITNTDPSPVFISTLLSPIAPALYALLYHLDQIKTSDPSIRESLNGLLATWGRVVSSLEGVDVLSTILDCTGDDWQVDMESQISRSDKPHVPSLALLTPEDLCRADGTGELDLDANLLNLYPDPVHLVQFLKSIDRADISSELFVKLLEGYRDMKAQRESDPMRTLLYLQLVIQMQTQSSDGLASSNILAKPAHMLSFIKHVLESATPTTSSAEHGPKHKLRDGPSIEALRFIPDEVDDLSDRSDSDDDTPGSEVVSADDEMTETAVNLLLSILEANEDLSARTAPVLNDIFSLLESLANNSSITVRSLAREAGMVMTARLASTSPQKSVSNKGGEDDVQEIYQKALKLLQDPILPVRAHGLLLLRQLVAPQSNQESKKPQIVDPALVPAILSIFLQSIQDDDSYIFLNAVQGLAGMVDTFGKDILKGLVKEYVRGLEGLGGTNLTQQDVDTRIRIGEALSLVIRRCGNTLGAYDILVPPLFGIVRASHVPTTLRTSSLSLLAECECTHPLSLLPYAIDLSEAMIDLLQTESVPASHRPRVHDQSKDKEDDQPTPTMDSHPTSTNSKVPPLRRAALHFLSLLIRETTKHMYDTAFGASPLPDTQMKRARATLAYLAYTDEDMVVRVMAREAGEGLAQLGRAMMGI